MSEQNDERGHNGLTSEETIREMMRPVPRDWKDEQIAALTAENARLSEALQNLVDGNDLAHSRKATLESWPTSSFRKLAIDALAARASTPPDANTSWFCVPCGFTTRDAAEAQAHLGPHIIRFKCSFCEATCGFHTQYQFDLNVQEHLARHAAQLSTPTPEAR